MSVFLRTLLRRKLIGLAQRQQGRASPNDPKHLIGPIGGTSIIGCVGLVQVLKHHVIMWVLAGGNADAVGHKFAPVASMIEDAVETKQSRIYNPMWTCVSSARISVPPFEVSRVYLIF